MYVQIVHKIIFLTFKADVYFVILYASNLIIEVGVNSAIMGISFKMEDVSFMGQKYKLKNVKKWMEIYVNNVKDLTTSILLKVDVYLVILYVDKLIIEASVHSAILGISFRMQNVSFMCQRYKSKNAKKWVEIYVNNVKNVTTSTLHWTNVK